MRFAVFACLGPFVFTLTLEVLGTNEPYYHDEYSTTHRALFSSSSNAGPVFFSYSEYPEKDQIHFPSRTPPRSFTIALVRSARDRLIAALLPASLRSLTGVEKEESLTITGDVRPAS